MELVALIARLAVGIVNRNGEDWFLNITCHIYEISSLFI